MYIVIHLEVFYNSCGSRTVYTHKNHIVRLEWLPTAVVFN